MSTWKRNLLVCSIGTFFITISLSQIAPVLPLYIKALGVRQRADIAQLSGFSFGITFILSALFSPIWGHAADRVGQKPMLLRASLGMAAVVACMGLATNVDVFIGLRLVQGAITGYNAACIALIAAQTDKTRSGWALGILSAASSGGSLVGPLVGGIMTDCFGLRSVFFITSFLILITFLLTLTFIEEPRQSAPRQVHRFHLSLSHSLPERRLTAALLLTNLFLTIAIYAAEPIMTIYVGQLNVNHAHIALLSGLVFSVAGLAGMLAAPLLGKLSDRLGPHKILLAALTVSALLTIQQAFVTNLWQLIILRALCGFVGAGIAPAISMLIQKITPPNKMGGVFGLSLSAIYLGSFGGAAMGGQLAARFGIPSVFYCAGSLLIINACWMYIAVYRRITHVL
ncbi:MAG: MFS transporter [Sporolactobacillus sp.]